ncbi:hypothetical protein ONZ45_g11708 [Pleurotus djamor]|nr:hypothetical protein ONZ45_g11708 [Pleurotus djamor]
MQLESISQEASDDPEYNENVFADCFMAFVVCLVEISPDEACDLFVNLLIPIIEKLYSANLDAEPFTTHSVSRRALKAHIGALGSDDYSTYHQPTRLPRTLIGPGHELLAGAAPTPSSGSDEESLSYPLPGPSALSRATPDYVIGSEHRPLVSTSAPPSSLNKENIPPPPHDPRALTRTPMVSRLPPFLAFKRTVDQVPVIRPSTSLSASHANSASKNRELENDHPHAQSIISKALNVPNNKRKFHHGLDESAAFPPTAGSVSAGKKRKIDDSGSHPFSDPQARAAVVSQPPYQKYRPI